VPGFEEPSRKVQKFKAFAERSKTNVKAVMTPLGGQSVNPALEAHHQILKQVV